MILGDTDIYGDFITTPQQLRWDYVRSGATPGGVGEGVYAADCEMIVDGSGAGGVTYAFAPSAGEDWVISDALVGFYCGTGAGPAVWGTMANPLTNGVLVQLNRTGIPQTTGITTLLNNMDMMTLGQLSRDDDGVTYAAMATWRPPGIGGMVLRGRTGVLDQLQFIVRDDMTAVGGGTTFWAKVRAYKLK